MSTPSSSIDLTSQSVPHLSLSFLCRIFLILDKLKIATTKDSLHHAGKNGSILMGKTCMMLLRMGSIPVWRISMEIISTHTTSTSLVVPKSLQETQHLCHPEHCLFFIGPEHQVSKIYEYLTKRHIKSIQHMDNPNAFSNYVKTTVNHGLSLSEVDLGDL